MRDSELKTEDVKALMEHTNVCRGLQIVECGFDPHLPPSGDTQVECLFKSSLEARAECFRRQET